MPYNRKVQWPSCLWSPHGINYARQTATAASMLATNELTQGQLEFLMKVTQIVNQSKLEERMATHLFDRFGTIKSNETVYESEPIFSAIKRKRFPEGFLYRGNLILP